MVPEAQRPRSGNPELERTVPELERLVEVAIGAAHRQCLALGGERGGDCGVVAHLLGERQRLLGDLERLRITLGPERRVGAR